MKRRSFLIAGSCLTLLVFAPFKLAHAGLRSWFKKKVKKVTPTWLDRWGSKVAKKWKGTTIGKALRRWSDDVEGAVKKAGDEIQEFWYQKLARGLYLSRPTLHRFNVNAPGSPVYYVNGAGTTLEIAKVQAENLAVHLIRPVYLLHNSSFVERIDGDNPNQVEYAAGAFVDIVLASVDRLWRPPLPSPSRSTRQLAHILVNSSHKVSLVTHSQGCLIAQNACLIALEYERKRWLQSELRWVACGSPIGNLDASANPMNLSEKFTDLVTPGDFWVAQVLGNKSVIDNRALQSDHPFRNPHPRNHEFSIGSVTRNTNPSQYLAPQSNWSVPFDYLSMISNDMLWIEGRTAALPTQFDTKLLAIENSTRMPLQVRVSYEKKFVSQRRTPRDPEVHTNWQWVDVQGEITVPPLQEVIVEHAGSRIEGRNFRVQAQPVYGMNLQMRSEDPVTPYSQHEKGFYVVQIDEPNSMLQKGLECISTAKHNGREIAFFGGASQFLFSLDDQHNVQVFKGIGSTPNNEHGVYDCVRGNWQDGGGLVPVGKQLWYPNTNKGQVQLFEPNTRSLEPLLNLAQFNDELVPDGWVVPTSVQPDGTPIFDEPEIPKTEEQPFVLGVKFLFDSGKQGGLIEEVYPGTPAKVAGLEKNDIVLNVDGVDLNFSTKDRPILDRAGRRVRLHVVDQRTGNHVEVVVDLNAR